jgi:hypothetical protein
MQKKELNDGIASYQQQLRKSTLEKIQDAIDEINADGAIVTKKKLIELTGLSNATFSKEHVKSILKSNKVCAYKYILDNASTSPQNQLKSIENQMHHYIKQAKSDELRIGALKSDIEVKKRRIQQLHEENSTLSRELAILRGMHHSILQALQMRGIEIDTGYDRIL